MPASSRPTGQRCIAWLAKTFSPAFTVHVEVGVGPTAPDDLRVVARHQLRAKVRTGGLAPDAFPAPASLVAFIESARDAGVPFKATAGLHHAMRGAYPLSDEIGAQSATMHGFVNVMLATAAVGERFADHDRCSAAHAHRSRRARLRRREGSLG
jgi:hypothetical protein